MKKNLIISIVIALIAIAAGGGYYYYYNFVETETHYYLLRYTPPQKLNNPYGYPTHTEPKVDLMVLQSYISDSVAVADVKKKKESDLIWGNKELEKLSKQNPTDDIEQIEVNAKITALKSVLEEQWAALCVTHTRNFDLSKVKEVLKIWNDSQKIEEFNNKYKISVRIYPI